MELYEAQNAIRDLAVDIHRHGMAAAPPNMSIFLMSTILVLEDLMETVKKLDDEYNK